nr:immunoglobulin light chain junction region [Macaca mulatta]
DYYCAIWHSSAVLF